MTMFGLLAFAVLATGSPPPAVEPSKRPNILLFFVDDWGRYAGIYADRKRFSANDIVRTPNFDRVGREGVVFDNAFVAVSSCSPSRASLVTGQYFWKCGSRAFPQNSASTWREAVDPFTTMTKFPDLLRGSGYYATRSLKTLEFTSSTPGSGEEEVPVVKYQRYGRYVSGAKDEEERRVRIEETLNHPRYEMRRVLKGRPTGHPFFFVYGPDNVHRPYAADSGRNLWGIQPDSLKGRIPTFLPDVNDVRRDFADYLGEVQAADAMLGVMLKELEAARELDNTLIIVSGDNGIPGIPRGKTNCYDLSVAAPLIVRWPPRIHAGRRVKDFVSLMDLGPTLLEIAGLPVPQEMHGRSFLKQLTSMEGGWIEAECDWVVVGRELHFHTARDGNLPYPMRAIRTREYLYIRNFKPDRWPNGAPYNIEDLDVAADYDRLADGPFRDLDASLTKSWLLANRAASDARTALEFTLGRRPAEELYAVHEDPDSLHNLAANPAAANVKKQLADQLISVLERTGDPRLKDLFDRLPYIDPSKVRVAIHRSK